MRPVLLELEGFGAFKLPTVVDFADTDFFALVGPTGSGKSTVIDAICFALYGAVPRYGDERLVGPVMSAGHQETGVRLTFDVGGERYVAARVVRRDRNGRVSTKEARLETADGRELAGRASEMAAQVERVLGFPFAHFTRCVVLPQGEFARFLHDRPADRQALLVELLDLGVYERMAREANRRAAEAGATARSAGERLAGLAHATPEALDAAFAVADRLARLVVELARAAPAVVAAERELAAATAEAGAARQRLAALDAVDVPAEARQLGQVVAVSQRALIDADRAHAAAAVEADVAAAARLQLPERAALGALVAAHLELASLTADAVVAIDAVERASDHLAAVNGRQAQAVGALVEAEQGLVHARERFAAQLLATGLTPGDACPVCGQDVHEPPAVPPPVDLQPHQDAVRHARAAAEDARDAVRRAEVAVATLSERRARLGQRQGEVLAAVADHPDPAELDLLVARVDAATEAERIARTAERAGAVAVSAARRTLEDARARAGGLAAGYHAQRDAVSALGAPPPGEDVLASWEALATWAADRRPEVAAAVAEADQAARATLAAHAELLGGLRSGAAELGVDPGGAGGLDDLRASAAATHARAAAVVGALERDVADVERLTAAAAAAETQAAVAQELGRLLSARKFERWLVGEALDRLAAGASTMLRRLSGGQYSLAIGADGEFTVVDHANADEVRPVRTLSGGETFQASLALALALADELAGLAAGGVAKLDAIFLDEGFGTLDPESLETVAATVESLGSSGRMVGVVTHVRELASRVPVRFEVRKTPVTATVERVAG